MNLQKVLDLLRNARANLPQEGHEGGDSEVPTVDPVVESENESEEPEREWNRFERYQQSTMDEVSDDEFWRFVHHGPPTVDEHPRHHREYMYQSLKMMMRETNDLLRNRIRRLQRDLEAASLVNDQPGMNAIQMQILEAQNLMYSV